MIQTIAELVNTQGNFVVTEISNRLEQGANIDECNPESDCTGLHNACQHVEDRDPFYSYISDYNNGFVRMPSGSIGMVKFLLENNAAVDALDKFGRTPLYYACMIDCPEVIMCLIKADADVNARDDEGVALLSYLLADSKLIEANEQGTLFEDANGDKPIRVKANAIKILRENGAECDSLSAMQEANLEIVENSFGKHNYRIGRLASMVPYGLLGYREFRAFWRIYKEHDVTKSEFKGTFDLDELKTLSALYQNQTEFIGSTKEWFYILIAFKIYYEEYQLPCDVMYLMDGDNVTYHKDLFKGPFEYIPKLINVDDLTQHLPELVKLLRSGAFDEIAVGPLALPNDVEQFWTEEHQERRLKSREPLFGGPPSATASEEVDNV